MEIKYLKPIEFIECKNYMNNILDILVECDKEFVPPLSVRNSTKQTDFNFIGIHDTDNKPMEYFRKITEQHNILTIEDGIVIAFMSFINDYDKNEFFHKNNIADINNYISTICVRKEFRRKGITEKMYEYIENNLPKDRASLYVSTRTWSTNLAHINLLKKRNYENTYTIKNDRILEDGTKVDTVYFGKNLRR